MARRPGDGPAGALTRLEAILERHPRLWRALGALLIGALTWPATVRSIPVGLDPSWATALHLALRDGLAWGRDLVFTYGPLGFLGVPDPWFGLSTVGAMAFLAIIHLALVAALLVTAARVVGLPGAMAGTFLLAQTFVLADPFTLLTALSAIVCVQLVAVRRAGPLGAAKTGWSLPPEILAAGLGVAAAVACLGKLNAGMFIGAMAAITVVAIGRPWWRSLAAYVAAGTAGGLAIWMLAGGSLADLGAWITGSLEVVSGYSAVMGVDLYVTDHWRYLAFAGLVGLIACHALAMARGGGWAPRRRLALAGVIGVVAFAMWKVGFVRWYSAYAFIVLAVLLVGVLARERGRQFAVASWALAYVVIVVSSGLSPARILDPRPALRYLRDDVLASVSTARRDAAVEATQARQRELYAIEPVILEALRGHSIHVDPTQTAVLSAYPDLDWRPLPVFQAYSAYTPRLDDLNAAALRGPSAPDRILREAPATLPGGQIEVPVTIDGRFRWWEEPATTLETWCRYTEVAATARWQVLARTDRSCAAPTAVATIRSGTGQTIRVPDAPPDRFLVVRIHGLEPDLVDQVGTVLFKPLEWYAWLDGVRYRLVQTNAAQGLLLAVPASEPASAPFAFGPAIRTVRIGTGPTGTAALRPLTFEFLTVGR